MEKNKISAGSYDLNKWLFGGYEKDIITMIAGPAGSGKRIFVLLLLQARQKKRTKLFLLIQKEALALKE